MNPSELPPVQSTLDASNPSLISYHRPPLEISVLGGINLDSLDRMRVTLKITSSQNQLPALRHNLDLYNDSQSEKLIRKCAQRLEVGGSLCAQAFAELTEHLEAYRLEHQDTSTAAIPEAISLSAEEHAEAQAFLKGKGLLERTNNLIGQSGVIGEDINRLLMYLIFTSRKRQHPLHAVSLGSSGTGKTHLQSTVGQLIPEEDRLEITTLTENALYYFGQQELRHKLILIEDLDGAESTLYPIRELQSKRRITKTIASKDHQGDTRARHLCVEGPVSIAGCTTREQLYEDNANRSFLLYLDESPEQDERIMAYQRALSAGKIDVHQEKAAALLLQNCQRLLEPIRVVNPYAEHLKIPQEVFKPRRTNAHYLAFIEAITFYHQGQRPICCDEATGEAYIETTLEDIQAANRLMKDVLLRKSDQLSGACRNYFESLKSWLRESGQTVFTNTQVRQALRPTPNANNQKRFSLQLQQAGFIRRSTLPDGEALGDRKNGFYYEVVSMDEYQHLQSDIENVLDQIYTDLATAEKNQPIIQEVGSGSEAVHAPGEPLPAAPVGQSGKRFTKTQDGQAVKKSADYLHPQSSTKPALLDSLKTTLQALTVLASEHGTEAWHKGRIVAEHTHRTKRTETRCLKTLADQGIIERLWQDRAYLYRLPQSPKP